MCDFSQYDGPSEEWLALEAAFPMPSFDVTQDPKGIRHVVNTMRAEKAAAEMLTLGQKVKILDHNIPTRDGSSIEARSYRPASKDASETLPVYLYFHGGGYLFGTLSSEDAKCSLIADHIGVVVFNVNYRHTPEFTFPTAWLDAQDSFVWLHKNIATIGGNPSQVVVGGISAGASLTASLVLEKHLGKTKELQGLPEIAGQILMVPTLVHRSAYDEGPLKKMKSREICSRETNANAPMLPKHVGEFFVNLLQVPSLDFKDTKLNIVNASPDEVKGFPPTVIAVAGMDMLRDEGLLFAKLLTESGVPTSVSVFKGVPHSFRSFGAEKLKICEKWDEVIENGILWALEKPKATETFEVKAY